MSKFETARLSVLDGFNFEDLTDDSISKKVMPDDIDDDEPESF